MLTSNRKLFEQNFILRPSFFFGVSAYPKDGVPGVDVYIPGDISDQTAAQRNRFYSINENESKIIFNPVFFNSLNPFKFVKDISLIVTSVSFLCANSAIDVSIQNPVASNNGIDTGTATPQGGYGLSNLLPFLIDINNKITVFSQPTRYDQNYDNLGFDQLTGESVNPIIVGAAKYSQLINKQFELSTIPLDFSLTIDIEQTQIYDYVKAASLLEPDLLVSPISFTAETRLTIIEYILFELCGIVDIRIDGIILSTIDYDFEKQTLTKQVELPLSMPNLEKMLSRVLKEKPQKKGALTIFREVFGFEPTEINTIIHVFEQMKNLLEGMPTQKQEIEEFKTTLIKDERARRDPVIKKDPVIKEIINTIKEPVSIPKSAIKEEIINEEIINEDI